MRISDWSSDVCSSDLAVAAARLVVGKRNASSPRCRFAQEEGRSGGRINLVPVMHFDDLDVPVLAEASRRVLHQSGEQVNAQGCVTRLQNGNGLGGLIDERMMERSEERRVGKECGSTCRSGGAPYH